MTFRKMGASILILGPLIADLEKQEYPSGGCAIGTDH